MAIKPIKPLFNLMWFSTHTQDLTRLQEIAEKYLPLAAWKDAFSISRDELYWLLQQANAVQALEARVDELMLEHCPDEMTPEQLENYAKHQVKVDEPIWE